MTVAEIRQQAAQAALLLQEELRRRVIGQEYPRDPRYRAVEMTFPEHPHHQTEVFRGGGSVRCASEDHDAEDFWIGTNSFIPDGELARMFFDRFSPICPMLYSPFLLEDIWEVEGLSVPPPEALEGPVAERHREYWLALVESEEREDRRWTHYPKKNRRLRCGHIAPQWPFEGWGETWTGKILRRILRIR